MNLRMVETFLCFKNTFQKKAYHSSISFFVAMLLISGISQDLYANYGLRPLTDEQIQHVQEHYPHVVKVRPNKIGLNRIQKHLKKQGNPAIDLKAAHTHEEEISTITGLAAYKLSSGKNIETTPLPSSVNNSTLPSFPPIGNQENLGSCVAWASTYYQATQEIGLLNGINNKTSQAGILSPKWTYNLLNGGQDEGLVIMDAYSLLSQNGATNIVSFPYDNNFTAWDLNSQDWVGAISKRMTAAQLVSGVNNGNSQNLTAIKQLLNNGHVLTFGTYIDSWVFTTVKQNPHASSNPYAGQLAASWQNGFDGGHCPTIVGYDDNVWIDVNGNGVVDSGELGAFLIANSWGSDWGNNGFVWISYDAFLTVSAVPNGPGANRVPAADGSNSYLISALPKAPDYSPKLIAQFTLKQAVRNQIGVLAGISDTAHTSPTQTFNCFALDNQGGPLEFNGTNPGTAETATFAVDFTDLLVASGVTGDVAQRFFLSLSDDAAGNSTTLTSFDLIDKVHNVQVSNSHVPLVCDNSEILPYIDYDFNGGTSPVVTNPVVTITSPANNAAVEGDIDVAVNATENLGISKVEFYVDSVLTATDTQAPYLFSLDTTALTNGTHVLLAKAYDTANNTATSSISVNVQNTTVSSIYVNAGGNAVVSRGITWLKDKDFTNPSQTNANNNLTFANPVYNTERFGDFSYIFSVSNGTYHVTLKFAELQYKRMNKRVFNVLINGKKVIKQLDLVKVAGFGGPYDLTFPVTVTNGQIKIDFKTVVGAAKINAIQITSP